MLCYVIIWSCPSTKQPLPTEMMLHCIKSLPRLKRKTKEELTFHPPLSNYRVQKRAVSHSFMFSPAEQLFWYPHMSYVFLPFLLTQTGLTVSSSPYVITLWYLQGSFPAVAIPLNFLFPSHAYESFFSCHLPIFPNWVLTTFTSTWKMNIAPSSEILVCTSNTNMSQCSRLESIQFLCYYTWKWTQKMFPKQ
jgi:hypothetical protein